MHGIVRLAAALALAASLLTVGTRAADAPLIVVAAENFYGDIARQIGGDRVAVVSIMNNPDQDPHLFETTPGIVRQIAGAQVAIFNGADYDPWMEKLLAATPRPGRLEINVAAIANREAGGNPHLWYDPAIVLNVARACEATFGKTDRAHAKDFAARLAAFEASLKPVNDKIAAIRAKYAGAAITATEPVFGPMAAALGLAMRNERFQLAMMNDTEPSPRDIAAFEDDLRQHKVKVLIYNTQVTGKLTQRLLDLARQANVPVVGITEMQPANVSFQDWMLGELSALEKALGRPNS
jgi:zinc/manganese transport system substrate-binding protein